MKWYVEKNLLNVYILATNRQLNIKKISMIINTVAEICKKK